ncbi:MaoC family dehydratase [Rickettsiales bacterium]|nr:MaoC family dehydratase [Rickettsiales bacterium]
MTKSYSQIITEKDVNIFSNLSKDKNPIHLDSDYAKKSRYKKKIVHGFLTSSFFSGIFGCYLPGEGCVYVSQNLNFKRPVYINDTVTATVSVKRIDLKRKRVFFETKCIVGCKIVVDGEAEIFIP